MNNGIDLGSFKTIQIYHEFMDMFNDTKKNTKIKAFNNVICHVMVATLSL